jgi:two-component system sensor histidine kinase ArlS
LKIRTKITLLFALLVTAILVLVSVIVYYFTEVDRHDAFMKRLRSRANYNAQIYSLLSDSNYTILDRINRNATILLPKKTINIFNTDGKLLYEFLASDAEPLKISSSLIQDIKNNTEKIFRVTDREGIASYFTEFRRPLIVVIVAYDEDGWKRLERMRRIFMLSLVLGVGVAFMFGRLFSNQLLTPIARMIGEVNKISSQNLTSTLFEGKNQDEMNTLARTFNQLLQRLQEAFSSQRRFISNASHELSTPLTSISSQLQVAMQRNRSIEEYQKVMQSIQEDVQQMLQLTRTLLEIAKTGGQGSIELKEVRIDELLFKILADVQKINSLYKVELDFDEFPESDHNFLVFGNAELLYMSIKNVIENGCKFSFDHRSKVKLSFHGKAVHVQVHNEGNIISKEEQENIFQPFYRARSSTQVQGFGLGLALARRIVALHKGSITVQSSIETGTTFLIILPTIQKVPSPIV